MGPDLGSLQGSCEHRCTLATMGSEAQLCSAGHGGTHGGDSTGDEENCIPSSHCGALEHVDMGQARLHHGLGEW